MSRFVFAVPNQTAGEQASPGRNFTHYTCILQE